MLQPFCNLVESRVIDGALHLTVQLRATVDTDDIPGVMVDNTLYRQLAIDLDNGDLLHNYTGPIHL